MAGSRGTLEEISTLFSFLTQSQPKGVKRKARNEMAIPSLRRLLAGFHPPQKR